MGEQFPQRMPSITSLIAAAPPKRQRRLNFQSSSDHGDSSDAYSNPSQSQDSQPSSAHGSLQHQRSTAVSMQQSVREDGVDSDNQIRSQHDPRQLAATSHHRQTASARQGHAPANALIAVAAAMGSSVSDTSRSIATRAAAAAAAVTPLTARRSSSCSGKCL